MAGSMGLAGCYIPACDTALRLNTLTIDFSSFPGSGTGFEFMIECPGKDSCDGEPDRKRFDAATENSVGVIPGIEAVHVLVYEKGSQNVVAEQTLDPIPWDPPVKPNTCPIPAKATIKL
jgi:hypothetical protein